MKYSIKYNLEGRDAGLKYDTLMAIFKTLRDQPGKRHAVKVDNDNEYIYSVGKNHGEIDLERKYCGEVVSIDTLSLRDSEERLLDTLISLEESIDENDELTPEDI